MWRRQPKAKGIGKTSWKAASNALIAKPEQIKIEAAYFVLINTP